MKRAPHENSGDQAIDEVERQMEVMWVGVDGCRYSFGELAQGVLPGHMQRLRESMKNPRPLEPLARAGIGPARMAQLLGLSGDFVGCYVFLDGNRPIYVGRSKHVLARVLEHVRPGDHYTATLAYRMAFAHHPHETTAVRAMATPEYRRHFDEERAELIRMSLAFVEIPNHLELYLFEVYCAMELQTGCEDGGWNTFATH